MKIIKVKSIYLKIEIIIIKILKTMKVHMKRIKIYLLIKIKNLIPINQIIINQSYKNKITYFKKQYYN